MTDFLLQEDGSGRIELEDGSGFLIQETSSVPLTSGGVPFIASKTVVKAPQVLGGAWVSQVAVETLLAGVSDALLSQVAVEVLQTNTTAVTNAGVSQLAIEVLVKTPVQLPFIGSVTAVYTPTIVSSSPEVDVPFISSVTALYTPIVATTSFNATTGQLQLLADDVVLFLASGQGSAIMLLNSDGATIAGTVTVAGLSAELDLRADAPTPLTATGVGSAVLSLAGDAPSLSVTLKPSSGALSLAAAAPPYVLPQPSPTGGATSLAAAGPGVLPIALGSAVLNLTAAAPTIWAPAKPTAAAVLNLRADAPTFAFALIVAESGLLLFQTSHPVVTPLTEPTEPPPAGPSTGIRARL